MRREAIKRCHECGRVYDGDSCPECGYYAQEYFRPETYEKEDEEFVYLLDKVSADADATQ